MKFPVIDFILSKYNSNNDNIILSYFPKDYLQSLWMCQTESINNIEGTKLLGLAIQSDSSDFGSVLGATFLQGFHTIYDRENKRIGFSKVSDCPSSLSSCL